MGGSVIRNEPATTALLEHYPVAYQIFQQAGWLSYFQRLQGYNEQQVLQFAQNLQEDHSVVQGVRISVTEEDIAQVSGLPIDDIRMFSRKHIIQNAQQNFFLPEERIEFKGRGVQLSSLPPPWPEVARFIKHYLTCEGRYQVVYQHDFLLLSHLRHNRRVNIPYYLLGCLKNMAHYCRKAKDPTLSLTHHRLVQLLIQRGFSQQNPPLNNPPINPQELLKFLKTPRSSNRKTPQTPQKYPIARPQNQSVQSIPLPYQARLIPYQNHPLPPFIFLVMTLSQIIPPAPSLRKDLTKTKTNSLLSALLTKKANKGLNKATHYCHYPRPPTHSTDTPYTSNLPNPGIFAYSTHGH
jgi:hypothetical protein